MHFVNNLKEAICDLIPLLTPIKWTAFNNIQIKSLDGENKNIDFDWNEQIISQNIIACLFCVFAWKNV